MQILGNLPGRGIFRLLRIDSTAARLIGLVLLGLLLAVRLADPTFVSNIRHQSFDLYQRMKPRVYQQLPVRIVDIDEASLKKYGQWPWPRTLLAELVDKLRAAGAGVIAFDIIFAEEDRLSPPKIAQDNPNLPSDIRAALAAQPPNEKVFAQAIANARVVLGQSSVRVASDSAEDRPVPDASFGARGGDPKPYLQQFPALVQNLPELEEAAAGRGVFSLSSDPDGVYRRVPLVVLVGDKVRLALSAEMLRVATGGNAFQFRVNEAGIDGLILGRLFPENADNLIRTTRNGRVWPYFTAIEDVGRYVPASAVLEGTADPAKLRGNLIFVGTSAIGLEDYRATPMAATMPGVEIHAQVVESILSRQMLVRPNYAITMELSALLAIGLVIIYLVPRMGAVWALVLAAGLQVLFAGGSVYAFTQHRLLIDATFPVAATALMFVALATANYIREEQQRQQIRGAFGQYISPDLVEQLSEDPERMVLGGETKELTLLFSDVRGFTGISEQYMDNPQGLTSLMNRFLTVLSAPVLEYKGTIDKYMGDAIMAFWNAPIEAEDHALRGCRAALGMIAELNALNAKRREEAPPGKVVAPIRVGIGINTGQCVVGNMGSELRFDYTALGDTVNIASRLEGQSKPYGLPIVIGENTAKLVRNSLAVIEIDLIRVKGKQRPERMFALLGDEELAGKSAFTEMVKTNLAMVEAYRTRAWKKARTAKNELAQLGRKSGVDLSEYLKLYEARIAEFQKNPPPRGWDGVYTATSK